MTPLLLISFKIFLFYPHNWHPLLEPLSPHMAPHSFPCLREGGTEIGGLPRHSGADFLWGSSPRVTCCSVTQPWPTLCDPMDCSTPGFPVLHYLSKLHLLSLDPCPLNQWCHPTISFSSAPFSSCPQPFPASGSFSMSWRFASSGQSTGASASAFVLPMSIQGWFPLGLTGLTSLLSKGRSRVSSSHFGKS